MTTQWQRILTLVVIFLLGVIAGSGLGYIYGQRSADIQLERQLAEVESQYETVNDNYLILVREYNKLFSSSGPTVAGVAVTSVQSEMYQVPAAGTAEPAPAETQEMELPEPGSEMETSAELESDSDMVEAEPAATETTETEIVEAEATGEEASAAEEETEEEATTAAETEEAAAAPPPEAEFEAESVGGTGPLEGPPPQPFRFTDLSTGEITSWEWDFGDDNTSTEQNPKHTIRRCPNDLCTVSLTVCGPGGCDTEAKEEYLWVSESCTGC